MNAVLVKFKPSKLVLFYSDSADFKYIIGFSLFLLWGGRFNGRCLFSHLVLIRSVRIGWSEIVFE